MINGPGTLESFAPDLFERLVAEEVLQRTPSPVRVEQASYANPFRFTFEDFGAFLSILNSGVLESWIAIARGFTSQGNRMREAQTQGMEADARRKAAEADEAAANARLRWNEASEQELRLKVLRQLKDQTENDGPSAAALVAIIDKDPSVLELLTRVGALKPNLTHLPDGTRETRKTRTRSKGFSDTVSTEDHE